jgi:hypothetical protein
MNAVFTTLHFLHNLFMCPISCVGPWQAFPAKSNVCE